MADIDQINKHCRNRYQQEMKMNTAPETSFTSLTRAIEFHMQERERLEDLLRDFEEKAAEAEKELRKGARSQGIMLQERKDLLLHKLETMNAKNDRSQKLFNQNQEKERALEVSVKMAQSDLSTERDQLNGEFLKLQNPIFTELGIQSTVDFNLPEVDIENLQARRPLAKQAS